MANVVEEITIKKEIEDYPDSPSHNEAPDSSSTPPENSSSLKYSKAWTEDETRSLIDLHKTHLSKFKGNSFSKKQLLENIVGDLSLIGCDKTVENVRNKLKYLRTRYKQNLAYNAKHVEKRVMPFQDELEELFSMDYFDEQESYNSKQLNGNTSSSSHSSPTQRATKRVKTIPASHVDLRTVVTSKKKTKPVKPVFKKKINGKRSAQPLFQCGLCMEKFRTSFDMHGHSCKPSKAASQSTKKKIESSTPAIFHWNSLITMQFLDLMKEYQDSHKNSNFRKGPIWGNMSALMKRLGHKILPKELERKWIILSSAFNKTMTYNNTHKDKKKCAFFKRLLDLYEHPSSFNCFKNGEPAKMTVEVSPFSFVSQDKGRNMRPSASNTNNMQKSHEDKSIKREDGKSELISWLNNTWSEWKEMERKRDVMLAQRHNELMEMLSFLIDSNHSNKA